jgi:hypothetical protein
MLSVTFDTQPAEIYAIKIHSKERVEFAVIVPKCDPGRKEVNLYSRNIDILMKKELFFCVMLPEDTEKPEQPYTTDAATKQVPHTDQQRMPTSGSSQVPVLNHFTLADGVLYMKKVSSASENLSKFFSHVECALQETTNIEDAIAIAGDAMFDVRDSLGRSVGTCLASHPECPDVLLRVLFQDCKYDPYEPDCYGLTCIDWMMHNNMEHRIGLIVPEQEEDTTSVVKDKPKLTKTNIDPTITDTQKLIEQFKQNRVSVSEEDDSEESDDPDEVDSEDESYRLTNDDYLAIHNAIHSTANSVMINGVKMPVQLSKNNCRCVTFPKQKFMEQNKEKASNYAKMAKNGADITWIIREGKWGLIKDGKIESR